MFGIRSQFLGIAFATFCLTVLIGCQSSSSRLAGRKEAHAAEYAALPVEERTSVDKGALREGMHADAVAIAWGQPSIVSTNGEFIIWEYYTKRIIPAPSAQSQVMVPWSSTPVPALQSPPGRNSLDPYSRAAVSSYSGPVGYPVNASSPPPKMTETLDRTAVFQNGRLLSWSPK